MIAKRWRYVVSGLAVTLVLAACSSGGGTNATDNGNSTPTTTTTQAATQPTTAASGGSSNTSTAAMPTCQAKKFGPLTRCENFYTDFWPIMKKKMDELYQKAKATNGGKIVLWAWYPVSKDIQDQFFKQYPGLKIETKGLRYNIASSVVAAKATGDEMSDILGGTWTIGYDMVQKGYNAKINWADYGVPKVWLHNGVPWFPISVQGWVIQYNKKKVSTPPTDLKDLLDPKWKGQIAMNPTFLTLFGAYGLKYGKTSMVDLIKKLRSSGNLILTSDPQKLLSTGDVSMVLDSQGYSTDPNIGVAPFQGSEVWAIYAGDTAGGGNLPGGMLYNLWRAFDPTWLKIRSTNPKYGHSPIPWPGLPTDKIKQLSPVMTSNLDVWMNELKKGWATYDTPENAEQLLALQKAAQTAGGK